jgi:hypothetical protein
LCQRYDVIHIFGPPTRLSGFSEPFNGSITHTRGGFHAVLSTKRELMLLVVVYVFTIQVSTGFVPIERIIPQARHIPLYKFVDDPFRYGLANICQVPNRGEGNMATR